MAKKKQNLSKEELLEQALLPESECPYKVPDNWVWTKIMNISNLYNGDRGTNYPSKSDFVNEGVPFINAGALSYGKLDLNSLNFITEEKFNILKAGKVRKNDILYCLRGTLGKNAFLNEDIKGAIASSLCIIRGAKKINTKYLFYLINSEVIIMQQHRMDNGTAQPNLSAASVKNYYVPLPPLSEQQRIVERIESLFEKLDKSKELIQDAIDSFENRKTAILHKAFSGELTQKWREENGVGIESWEEIEMGEKIKLISGQDVSLKLCNNEGRGIPYILGASNLDNNVFTVERWIEIPKVLSLENDILISVKGTIGKLYFQREEKINISRQIMAIRNTGYWDNEYLYYQILSISENLKDMGNGLIPGISRDKILRYKIRVPSINEQKVISSTLRDFLVKEERAFDLYQIIEKIDLMKKAILERAFRGEFGTNDPLEESSISLLAEIIDDLQ